MAGVMPSMKPRDTLVAQLDACSVSFARAAALAKLWCQAVCLDPRGQQPEAIGKRSLQRVTARGVLGRIQGGRKTAQPALGHEGQALGVSGVAKQQANQMPQVVIVARSWQQVIHHPLTEFSRKTTLARDPRVGEGARAVSLCENRS